MIQKIDMNKCRCGFPKFNGINQCVCNLNAPKDIICWWSGGVTSAVACHVAIQIFGLARTRFVFIDTGNEDPDTHRFMRDCMRWYGVGIEIISNTEYKNIQEVWYKFLSLNVATGAICSTELKRKVRETFQAKEKYTHQVFGFDITKKDPKRAMAMTLNYPESNPIYPLLFYGYTKEKCIKILTDAGIKIPDSYLMGFENNNCLETGCVQGGIGYWQLMQKNRPDKFEAMAKVEHELTDLAGHPVTMLKDQSKGGGLVFLLPHPKYPHIKDISMMKGRPPQPLLDCNGFCGINDLAGKNKTTKELNYATP